MSDSRSRIRFREVIREGSFPLAEAALLVACQEYPQLDVRQYLGRLDEMAARVREDLAPAEPLLGRVRALNRYLFEHEGFHGNHEDYYDPRNSFLNDVLDRRTGIPVTLSVLYMELGSRCGLEAEGVGLPGHFIVRVRRPGEVGSDGEEVEQLVDPFHGGALLSLAECQARLDRIFNGRMRLQPDMLSGCDGRSVVGRMLRNLKAIYVKAQDPPRALRVMDLLIDLEPEAAEERRDRGLLYASLECFALAARDLEACLALAPAAPEAERLRAQAAQLRWKESRVN